MARTFRALVPPVAAALLGACLSYGPLGVWDAGENVRARNEARLLATPPPARLRFAVVGDVQRAFDEAAALVEHLNGLDLAFVVQVGDFTDAGLADEYRLMAGVFDGLRAPWFVVIGNHDYLGNGEETFDRVLGPRDHTFDWAGTRLVFLDTNAVEFGQGRGVPDLAWLEAALQAAPGAGRAIVFSHVWPWSLEFDRAQEQPFLEVLARGGAVLSFHGHDHTFRAREDRGVRYFIADHVDRRTFLLVEETDAGGLAVERARF